MQVDDEAWAAVRNAYESTSAPLDEIGAPFGLSRQRIAARAKKEGWQARPKRTVAPRRHDAKTADRTTKRALPTRKTQRAMIARLYQAITLKLEHMETRMASGDDRSAQDEERENRALATLINNFEKVTEAVAELDRTKPRARAAGRVGADAERMRREIAERLERLGGGGTIGRGSEKPRS